MSLNVNFRKIDESDKIIHGNGNKTTGANLTIYGNDNLISGDGCTVFGDHNVIKGSDAFVSGDHNIVEGEIAPSMATPTKSSLAWALGMCRQPNIQTPKSTRCQGEKAPLLLILTLGTKKPGARGRGPRLFYLLRRHLLRLW